MAEDLTQLIIGNLANKSALQAQCRKPRQRIGRRPARGFARWRHCIVKRIGLSLVNQSHAAAIKLQFLDQFIIASSNNIDHGIADCDDVITRFNHEFYPTFVSIHPARVSGSSQERQDQEGLRVDLAA